MKTDDTSKPKRQLNVLDVLFGAATIRGHDGPGIPIAYPANDQYSPEVQAEKIRKAAEKRERRAMKRKG